MIRCVEQLQFEQIVFRRSARSDKNNETSRKLRIGKENINIKMVACYESNTVLLAQPGSYQGGNTI